MTTLKFNSYLNRHWRLDVWTLGENHPNYVDSLNSLAIMYYDMGSYDKAEPLLQKALEITRKTLGENHPVHAYTLDGLAGCVLHYGSYTKAEPLTQKALEVRRKTLGDKNPDYARSLYNLALLYVNMGRYPDSLETYEGGLHD